MSPSKKTSGREDVGGIAKEYLSFLGICGEHDMFRRQTSSVQKPLTLRSIKRYADGVDGQIAKSFSRLQILQYFPEENSLNIR